MAVSKRRILVAAATLSLVAGTGAVTSSGVDTTQGRPGGLEIETISSAPDMVTGGDVLVEVTAPKQIPPHRISVTLDGEEVTDDFTWDADRRVLLGVVDGLDVGEHDIAATSPNTRWDTSVQVTNHPGEGPLFSGPHEEPFICETHKFNIPVVGENLGEPLDENCSAETRVDHIYLTTANQWAVWPTDATAYPENMAQTTTSEGTEVPAVVRMETGTANRGIYQHTVLHDPLTDPEPTPTQRPEGWNGKVIYTLGGGCTGGWFHQGTGTGGVTDRFMLGQGYAVVSSSLNVFGNNCSDLLTSETAAMTKEVFNEVYGQDDFTIGFGCSGGSYQAHQAADNYPGIFDGIVVGCSFPEVGFGTVDFITDARLLNHYFNDEAQVEWTDEQKRQVTGFATLATMPNVANGARRIDPTAFCPGALPAELRYHPETNPGGARCDVYDHTINAYGADEETGFALRPLDNVGIQYGLGTLQDGTITVDQFLDLNEAVGGYDHDGQFREERSQADLPAVTAAYQTGRLTNGGGGLAHTPIIDYRAYTDDARNGDIHVRYHTNSMRERLVAANGSAVNHVSLLEDNRYGGLSTNSPLVRHGITQMDAWLTALDVTDGELPSLEAIGQNRPAALVEGCMTRDENPEFLPMTLDRDPSSECEALYDSASFPREVAGESVRADVIKCQTTAPVREDYPAMDDTQWQRLQDVFAGGVCDYTVPGVEQQGLIGTWLRF
ncbi:tannase/feruloyl esterase family alpha/beta hydrolase [Ornithinimicrobium faecis]|uniref:Tannase/feruloyl esterase family alpha/beta hydrolase n=1 Tax=Ornithinimicrobium faecis TaxID=2934158 RepID=A0ABY4YW79_9MICO|nr:DUF6351 family protein [Ornithinimicrobium sp. HY1793]USQ80412.1 tannase/feruloyl esterase family alpha/beta hydrolase [Ornithinimicrobium sp. HY1793]